MFPTAHLKAYHLLRSFGILPIVGTFVGSPSRNSIVSDIAIVVTVKPDRCRERHFAKSSAKTLAGDPESRARGLRYSIPSSGRRDPITGEVHEKAVMAIFCQWRALSRCVWSAKGGFNRTRIGRGGWDRTIKPIENVQVIHSAFG